MTARGRRRRGRLSGRAAAASWPLVVALGVLIVARLVLLALAADGPVALAAAVLAVLFALLTADVGRRLARRGGGR